jgi:hypothetical protein
LQWDRAMMNWADKQHLSPNTVELPNLRRFDG